MTGPEHYRAAEQLLERAARRDRHGVPLESGTPELIATASVHATLALAAATGGIDPLASRWHSDAEAWKRINQSEGGGRAPA